MAVKFSRSVLQGSMKNKPGDFHQQSRFSVEIEGITQGGIHSVSGLESEHELIPYQDSDDSRERYRPGRIKPLRVTLERDWSTNTEFFDWFMSVWNGDVQRKSMSIVYLSDDGAEATRVNLTECWPAVWKLTGANARRSGHMVEVLEVVGETASLV